MAPDRSCCVLVDFGVSLFLWDVQIRSVCDHFLQMMRRDDSNLFKKTRVCRKFHTVLPACVCFCSPLARRSAISRVSGKQQKCSAWDHEEELRALREAAAGENPLMKLQGRWKGANGELLVLLLLLLLPVLLLRRGSGSADKPLPLHSSDALENLSQLSRVARRRSSPSRDLERKNYAQKCSFVL